MTQTICLALHPPTQTGVEDLPCWELGPPTITHLRADPSLATGPNDRYSRQTRAVLLLPDEQGWVQWICFAAGIALGDDIQATDPMASYRAGSNGLVRLTFTEGRAFWRELPTLLPQAEGVASQPAAVLAWAANLYWQLGSGEQSLLVAGLATEPGKVKYLRWRSERLSLPASLLTDFDRAELLRILVRRAEELFGSIRKLAATMLAETLPDSGSKDTYARARSLFDSGPAAALYFAAAERTLSQVMALLGSGDMEDLDKAEALWRQTLLVAAQSAWQAVRENLGLSPHALRADAKLYPRLLALLRPLRPPESNFAIADKEARA